MAAKKSENPAPPRAPEKAPPTVAQQKVKPYPFEISITPKEGVPPVKASILKLEPIGFIMRVEQDHHFKVGDNHQASFKLPVLGDAFDQPIKIIKTYDGMDVTSSKEHVKHYMVEAHFRSLPELELQRILKFLKIIRQK